MKLRIILVFCMILILSVLTGCQKTWTLQSEGIAAGNCEIVENRNVVCEKPLWSEFIGIMNNGKMR